MKQGQWAAEWKRVLKDFENAMKKENAGKVFQRVHESELKGVVPALIKADKGFADYCDAETTKEKREAIKQISTGHDSYRGCRENHRKALSKIVNNKKSAENSSTDLVKAVNGLGEQNDALGKNMGEAVLAMLNFVGSQARSERKIENVSKSLTKMVKETTKFIKESISDKTGRYYSENIDEVSGELYGLLRDLDKLIRGKKEIENSKAPPQSMLVDAKAFADPNTVSCMFDDGEIDLKRMVGILKELTTQVTAIEKWRKKTWP